MRRSRNKSHHDPVRDWDGKISAYSPVYGFKLISPEDRQRISVENMKVMATIERITREDAEANATPPGGMQYHRAD